MPSRLRILLIAAALVVSCAGNGSSTIGPPSTTTVAIKDNFFDPANVTVSAGSTILWVHQGFANHTVTSGSPASITGLFDSPNLTTGQTFQFTFAQPGTIPYFCRVHGASMSGTITVQ